MASSTLEKVRAAALKLPEIERAELAQELMASLDGSADADVEQAWDAEILRRLADIDAVTARLLDREELSSEVQGRLHRR